MSVIICVGWHMLVAMSIGCHVCQSVAMCVGCHGLIVMCIVAMCVGWFPYIIICKLVTICFGLGIWLSICWVYGRAYVGHSGAYGKAYDGA